MLLPTLKPESRASALARHLILLLLTALAVAHQGAAQNTPLISGGAGFFTNTNGGSTFYYPTIQPLLAAPIGKYLFIESRASLFEFITPKGGGQSGYDHSHFIGNTYLQGDILASRYGPLIANFNYTSSGSGLGGMLRGNAIQRSKYSIDYNYYYSTRSANEQFNSSRSSGGRAAVYLPEQRLEVGYSYIRLMQGKHENFNGAHVWWEPKDTSFRLRSEFGRGQHAQGYWVEADYRTPAFGGLDSTIGRFEPVFRIQQTFRLDNSSSDGLPSANTQRADFGLDYNLPHNTRILTSYARQFSATGNHNVWETGIVYRFLFPTWKGK
jgi:hypothetical protein